MLFQMGGTKAGFFIFRETPECCRSASHLALLPPSSHVTLRLPAFLMLLVRVCHAHSIYRHGMSEIYNRKHAAVVKRQAKAVCKGMSHKGDTKTTALLPSLPVPPPPCLVVE